MIKSDEFGNIYIYDASINAWIKKGIIDVPSIVDENNDGLITPRIVRKLELLEQYNYNKDQFSIYLSDNTDPVNYYYFRSPNNLINITHYDNILQFEVNRNVLDHNIIKLFQTKGPRGFKGPSGDKGRDGIQCDPEEFFYGTTIETGIYINHYVATPIDTEISLRIYDNSDNQIAEVWITLNNTIMIKSGEDNINSIDISLNDNILEGVINLKTSWDVKFKARQRGKKGKKGRDGLSYLEVKTQTIDDEFIKSKTALINLRKSPSDSDIYYYIDEVLKENIAHKITAEFTHPSENDLFPAVQLDNIVAKKIGIYKLDNIKPLEEPIYTLPQWIPNSNCRHFNDIDFDVDFDGIILKNDFKVDNCIQPFTFKVGGSCSCNIIDPIIVPGSYDESQESHETLPPDGLRLDSLYQSGENTYTKSFGGTTDTYIQPIIFSNSKRVYIKIESEMHNVYISSQILLDRSESVGCTISDFTEYSKLPINVSFIATANRFYYNINSVKIGRIDYLYVIVKVNLAKYNSTNKYTITIGIENV